MLPGPVVVTVPVVEGGVAMSVTVPPVSASTAGVSAAEVENETELGPSLSLVRTEPVPVAWPAMTSVET